MHWFGAVLLLVLAACSSEAAPTMQDVSIPPTRAQSLLPTGAPTPQPSTPTPRPGTPTPPITVTPTPTSAPSLPTSHRPFPEDLTVFGMPPLAPLEARDLLTSGALDGRFVAIEGWWSRTAVPCPSSAYGSLLDQSCDFTSLNEEPLAGEEILSGLPALHPVVAPEVAHGADLLGSFEPVYVVVIAHAGDARSALCPPQVRQGCRRTLVIDDVAWANGDWVRSILHGFGEPGWYVNRVESTGEKIGEVDPRFAGLVAGPVRLARYAIGPTAEDGTQEGLVWLESTAGTSFELVAEEPLALPDDYEPGRIRFDAIASELTGVSAQFEILSAGRVFATGEMDESMTPVVIEQGDYVIRAYLSDEANEIAATACELAISIVDADDRFYTATFSSKTRPCTIEPTERTF